MEEKQQQLLLLSVPIAAPLTLAMGVLSWVLFGEAVAIAVQQISN